MSDLKYDIIIIGAGVSGCAVARELSRYDLKICVLDKESDVCEGTSKANSGIVHAGHDAKPDTLKAKLNVQGNLMMEEMAKKLDFPFKRNGSLVVCQNEEELSKLEELKERGKENGVEGLRILTREEALELEPARRNCLSISYEYCLCRKCSNQWCEVPIWNVCAGYTEMSSSK